MVKIHYLSKLRIYHGRDEAVETIGDRDHLIDLLRDSKTHLRNELINSVMSCYSGIAYGDSNWTKFNGGWTTPKVPTIYGDFITQNKQLAQLSLDPGFVTHLPEFIEYMKKDDINTQYFFKLREDFKLFLGNRIIWRSMMLTEEEAKNVITQGIESNFFRHSKDLPNLIENFEANILSVYFNELIENHFHGENYFSPLVSVSSHEDVAIAVGRHFGRISDSKERKELYLFKINIPEVDLIYYTDHGVKKPYKLEELIKNETPLKISVNDHKTFYPWDKNTESYILYKINPEEIIDVSKPTVNKSSWNGMVC